MIEKSAAEQIVERVGRLPLAIAQAAAFITRTASDFGKYLERLCNNLTRFFFETFKSSGTLYPEGVVSCWRLSVEELTEDAARLLNVCAFLSNGGIPDELLRRGIGSLHWFDGGEVANFLPFGLACL